MLASPNVPELPSMSHGLMDGHLFRSSVHHNGYCPMASLNLEESFQYQIHVLTNGIGSSKVSVQGTETQGDMTAGQRHSIMQERVCHGAAHMKHQGRVGSRRIPVAVLR